MIIVYSIVKKATIRTNDTIILLLLLFYNNLCCCCCCCCWTEVMMMQVTSVLYSAMKSNSVNGEGSEVSFSFWRNLFFLAKDGIIFYQPGFWRFFCFAHFWMMMIIDYAYDQNSEESHIHVYIHILLTRVLESLLLCRLLTSAQNLQSWSRLESLAQPSQWRSSWRCPILLLTAF